MSARINGDVVPVRETAAAKVSHCAACAKKLHALRRRRLCQICSQFVCRQCTNSNRRRRHWFLRAEDSCLACVPCVQAQLGQRELFHQDVDENGSRKQLPIELKLFLGLRLLRRRPARRQIQRRRSCGDVAVDYAAAPTSPQTTSTASVIVVQDPVEACGACASITAHGEAIFTTACGHNFHWICLKKSTTRISNKCPVCHSTIDELQAKEECIHSRVYPGNRFCRDCGKPTTELAVSKQATAIAIEIQESHRSTRLLGVQLLRLLDDEAFECVQLLLAAFRLVAVGVARVAGIQWRHSVEFLALQFVRGLFYGLIYVVYGFYELLELRPLARLRSPQQN